MNTFLAGLARRKWNIVITTLVTVIIVAVGTTQEPMYQSSTLLRLLPIGASSDNRSAYLTHLAESYIALAESKLTTNQVEQHLHLTTLPEFTIERVEGTSDLLILTVTARDPVLAMEVANAIAMVLTSHPNEMYLPAGSLASAAIEEEVAAVEQEINELEAQYWALVSSIDASPEEIAEIDRTIEKRQRYYDQLVDAYGDSRVTRALQSKLISVVQPASIPLRPTTHGMTLLERIGVALAAGLVGGVTLAVVLDRTDPRLFSTQQAADAVKLPIVARVPEFRSASGAVVTDPRGLEAVRRLRTRLLSLQRKNGSKTFLFTSAEPGEGKSTVVSSLAYTLAESNLNVLAIDADMRRPTLHKHFNLPNQVGLSSVLQRDVLVLDAVQNTGVPHLDVLPSGPIPDSPAELLSDLDFVEAMLGELAGRYDFILLDTPPAIVVTDAAILAPLVDETLLVVMLSHSDKNAPAEVRALLQRMGVELAGVVVNLADRDASYRKYLYGQY
ncbi:MAG TPA: polysaccharide biosynthesis tyrosine autokinase [Aggregatilineales bacterium]|nr:polysaccharide biosynthesis tyrosine autokinase [Chloroflexota bacterium]HOA24004.1 polysaccharide biosynthesis tyrosine autokinase [Aggregatilineales bacterium]HPV07116.1 polysaccharide biosynthesis tyrosine autokinase [Aggregatilineales bacterium]HQA66698.1 polysaccharide biosynthesis tyrosine autokinase [Aggregatilineales bacterium]